MSTIVEITAAAELPELGRWIHDSWFDLDKIDFDREQGRLAIPILRHSESGFWKALLDRGTNGIKACLLVFNVVGITINDTEEVGRYDITGIDFDETARVLRVMTGIPLRFDISVTAVHVRVTERC